MNDYQINMERAFQFAINCKQEEEALDSLIGMEDYKRTMRQVIGAQKRTIIAQSRGRNVRLPSFHMCFIGNPGTGKTSASHKTAEFLYRAGIVGSDKLMVAGRSDLVGEHVGETALKTKKLLKTAVGSVLLIDEAYSLLDDRDGSYGDEAINTLVDEMEKYRGKLVIIFAGYPDKMRKFLSNNPGLRSRIPYTVYFRDYTTEQLYDIAEKTAKEDGYFFHQDVRKKLISIISIAKKDPEFGNARYVCNIVEKAEIWKSDQINILDLPTLSDKELFQLTSEDFSSITTVKEYGEERQIGFR